MSSDISPELLIVVPVFNEQASVRKVLTEWFQEIENWTEKFVILVINDGSTDDTANILQRLQQRLGARLEVITRENRGHGKTCLQGYQVACDRRIPHVLQIDSDGQCDPQYFFRFWRDRDKYDVIYGHRKSRQDGLRRVMASLLLKWVLIIFGNAYCVDANSPYRLMQTDALKPALKRMPPDFFLANVALSVIFRKMPGVRISHVKITFRERYGGEPNVPLSKFGIKAFELIRQLKNLR